MGPKIKRIQEILGIDGAISYSILGKCVGAVTTVFTVFFIARYLSPEEQGYYYTFASILSVQVFFELGLNSIITQVVAHEASYLHLDPSMKMEGDIHRRSRLSSLLHFCAKWYLILAGVFFITILIVGIFFFKKYSGVTEVSWRTPWALLAISAVINFSTAPINAFMQGLGKVKDIAKIRFIQQIVLPIIVWGGLMLGLRLYVSGINALVAVFVNIYLYKKLSYDKILLNIWKDLGVDRIIYIKEIFPYQWKNALSWVSGYFTFQLFNPVLFAVEGAVAAGKMGMTISAANAIQAVLLSWINTKIPQFSSLIEKKEYKQLDSLFYSNFKRIILLSGVLLVFFVAFVYILQSNSNLGWLNQFGDRFLPLSTLIVMTFAILLQIPIAAWATYLRCHLQEPFLINSITMGLLSILSALLFGKLYGSVGLAYGYLTIQIVNLFWSYNIYKTKKQVWHQ